MEDYIRYGGCRGGGMSHKLPEPKKEAIDTFANAVKRQVLNKDNPDDTYKQVKEEIKTWSAWKKEAYNNNFATSKHSIKV